MPPIVRRITNHSAARYIITGGASFLIELMVLFVLINFLNLPTVVAVAASFWVGLIVAFIAQKFFAFQDNSSSTKRLLKQSVAYGTLILVNYVFTIGFVSLFEDALGVYIARAAALAITTVWNYVIYAKIIFKKR